MLIMPMKYRPCVWDNDFAVSSDVNALFGGVTAGRGGWGELNWLSEPTPGPSTGGELGLCRL